MEAGIVTVLDLTESLMYAEPIRLPNLVVTTSVSNYFPRKKNARRHKRKKKQRESFPDEMYEDEEDEDDHEQVGKGSIFQNFVKCEPRSHFTLNSIFSFT